MVNNAGRQISVEDIADLSDEQWDATYQTNIAAIFRISKAAILRALPVRRSSTRLRSRPTAPRPISSTTPRRRRRSTTSPRASPSGWPRKCIRVNAVAPGPVLDSATGLRRPAQEALPEFGKSTPIGRAGQPTEVAPAYVFLTSPESSYVIGETLNVNGGEPSP